MVRGKKSEEKEKGNWGFSYSTQIRDFLMGAEQEEHEWMKINGWEMRRKNIFLKKWTFKWVKGLVMSNSHIYLFCYLNQINPPDFWGIFW